MSFRDYKVEPEDIDLNQNHIKLSERIKTYYDQQKDEFETIRDDVLGNESLADSYIPARISVLGYSIDLSNFITETFQNCKKSNQFQAIMICGQPGHGKTTFCKKYVYDFINADQKWAENVFQFSLNDSDSQIINFAHKTIELGNVFRCDGEVFINLDECQNSIIFLDGYDEIKALLEGNKYNTWSKFYAYINSIGIRKKIFFIITSRSNALTQEDQKLPYVYNLENLSYAEQKIWCYRKNAYREYWDTYLSEICAGKNDNLILQEFRSLLGIPTIFRMVVHANYFTGNKISNRTELYSELFKHIMMKRGLSEDEIATREEDYANLAFEIWHNDEDTTTQNRMQEISPIFLYDFYLKGYKDKKKVIIGFLHKSFYEFFVACYLFKELIVCDTSESRNRYLSNLSERRINSDILEYFHDLCNKYYKKEYQRLKYLDTNARNLLKHLNDTEIIGGDDKEHIDIAAISYTDGNGDKLLFDRCRNIYVNTVQLCFNFNVSDLFTRCGNLKQMMSRFSCVNIDFTLKSYASKMENLNLMQSNLMNANLRNSDLSYAIMYESNLCAANLKGAQMTGINLEKAALSFADLRWASLDGAIMNMADLNHANLSSADLREAFLYKTKLCKANMIETNLNQACLIGADLREANLKNTDLNGAVLIQANLHMADLSYSDLRDADLKNANLRNVNLRGTKLIGANLSGADLMGASVYETILDPNNVPKLNLKCKFHVFEENNLHSQPWHYSILTLAVKPSDNLYYYGEMVKGNDSDGISHIWYKVYRGSGLVNKINGWIQADFLVASSEDLHHGCFDQKTTP